MVKPQAVDRCVYVWRNLSCNAAFFLQHLFIFFALMQHFLLAAALFLLLSLLPAIYLRLFRDESCVVHATMCAVASAQNPLFNGRSLYAHRC